MNKKEALIECLRGKKVRGSDWNVGYYIYWDEQVFMDTDGRIFTLMAGDGAEWELYQEEEIDNVRCDKCGEPLEDPGYCTKCGKGEKKKTATKVIEKLDPTVPTTDPNVVFEEPVRVKINEIIDYLMDIE